MDQGAAVVRHPQLEPVRGPSQLGHAPLAPALQRVDVDINVVAPDTSTSSPADIKGHLLTCPPCSGRAPGRGCGGVRVCPRCDSHRTRPWPPGPAPGHGRRNPGDNLTQQLSYYLVEIRITLWSVSYGASIALVYSHNHSSPHLDH